MIKTTIQFPDGTTTEAVLSKGQLFAVHRPLGQAKDYMVTFLGDPTMPCVLRARLKGDATKAAGLLEWMEEVLGPDEVADLVDRLRVPMSVKRDKKET